MIISLSSIPTRFKWLERTLNSLVAQVRPAEEIRLHIPYKYRRFPDWDGTLPHVPRGVTIKRTETDFGPATKVLPAVHDLQGSSTDILFCDDDRVYDPLWTTRFLEQRTLKPNCAIVECGEIFSAPMSQPQRTPRAQRATKGARYRVLRALSLGLHKPHPWARSGYVDIAQGYGGVMVRPEFFPPEVFDIPDVVWMVDDYWLSGCLEKNGVGIWLNADGKMSRGTDAGSSHSLTNFSLEDAGRAEASAACVTLFQERHGIW